MNSIKNSINGLASSLLATVGFARLAEKLDPVLNQGGDRIAFMNGVKSVEFTSVCNFQTVEFTSVCNFQSVEFTSVCNFAAKAG